jgi:hypothetical protein
MNHKPFKDLPPLHLAAGRDSLRLNLQYIVFEGTIATVTNGNCLVRYDLREYEFSKSLDGLAIHFMQWAELFTNRKRILEIEVDKEANTMAALLSTPHKAKIIIQIERIEGYVDYHKVLPTKESFNDIPSIGVNPRLIHLMSKIAGGGPFDGLRLTFQSQTKAIQVTCPAILHFYGIIMPLMNGGEDLSSYYESRFITKSNPQNA